MYAIIETGEKQVRVEVGQKSYVDKINANATDEVTLDKVLLVAGDSVKIGTPYVEGASVKAKVEKNGLGKKLRIYKYKAKHNERKMQGRRQPYTCLVIEAINA